MNAQIVESIQIALFSAVIPLSFGAAHPVVAVMATNVVLVVALNEIRAARCPLYRPK